MLSFNRDESIQIQGSKEHLGIKKELKKTSTLFVIPERLEPPTF